MSAAVERRRVSCAGLCRVRDNAGRLLLGLNRDRLSQGQRIYMPLGGALKHDDPDLPARFDALPEAPGTHDLRLFVPLAQMAAFETWFRLRQGRETTPFRELREELVDEFRLLPALEPADVRLTYRGTVEAEATSGRRANRGALTLYLHEIFDVEFVAAAMRRLVLRAPAATGLRWLAEDEIRRGVARDGTPVDGRALLMALG